MKQGHGVLSVAINREATVRETANSAQVNSVPLRNSEQQRGHGVAPSLIEQQLSACEILARHPVTAAHSKQC